MLRPERESTGIRDRTFKMGGAGPSAGQIRERFHPRELLCQSVATLRSRRCCVQTPWIFKMSPPWHLSYLDKLLDGLAHSALPAWVLEKLLRSCTAAGELAPVLLQRQATHVLRSALDQADPGRADKDRALAALRSYYPEIKRKLPRSWKIYFEGQVQTWVRGSTLRHGSRPEAAAGGVASSAIFPDEGRRRHTPTWQVKSSAEALAHAVHPLLSGRAERCSCSSPGNSTSRTYYHPFVCDFAKLVYNPLKGHPRLDEPRDAIERQRVQLPPELPADDRVVEPGIREEFYPQEDVDFTPDGAYSPYNWELFLPRSAADRQLVEQKPALRGGARVVSLHLQSDRRGKPDAGRLADEQVLDHQAVLRDHGSAVRPAAHRQHPAHAGGRHERARAFRAQAKKELEDQVLDWRTNPFEPHRIANYRTVAYQKTVVMKYLDNLIAWGDYLFRQDSMESINEATQLYILAAEILGPRPKKIPPQAKPPVESFNELEKEFDEFSNALVEVENLVPPLPGNGGRRRRSRRRCRCSTSASRTTIRCWATGTRSPTGSTRSVTA